MTMYKNTVTLYFTDSHMIITGLVLDFGSCEVCDIPSKHFVEKQEVTGSDEMSTHFIVT